MGLICMVLTGSIMNIWRMANISQQGRLWHQQRGGGGILCFEVAYGEWAGQSAWNDYHVRQDNTLFYFANDAIEALSTVLVKWEKYMLYPPSPLELNPINNLWCILEGRIMGGQPNTCWGLLD